MPVVRRVILAGIGGLRHDAVERFSLFNLRRLANRGASAKVVCSASAGSAAGRLASVLTGVSPSRHGVTKEMTGLPRAIERLDPLAGCIAGDGFQVSAFLPEVSVQANNAVGLFGRDLGFNNLSFKGSTSSEVVSFAVNALCTQRRGLIALQFPDIGTFSISGSQSAEYGRAAQRIDQSLGILASLSGTSSGETLLVLIADGGEDSDVFVSLIGACIAPRILHNVAILDVPSTILWALGINVPRTYEGRVLAEAFGAESKPLMAFA